MDHVSALPTAHIILSDSLKTTPTVRAKWAGDALVVCAETTWAGNSFQYFSTKNEWTFIVVSKQNDSEKCRSTALTFQTRDL